MKIRPSMIFYFGFGIVTIVSAVNYLTTLMNEFRVLGLLGLLGLLITVIASDKIDTNLNGIWIFNAKN